MDKLEDFSKEKLQEIYEILPEDLKQALFSQDIADTINDIGIENNLTEKQIYKLIEYVGYVFLGLLSPNDFEKKIKEKLFIAEESARQINWQIVGAVFIPLKNSLELIYETKIAIPTRPNISSGTKDEKQEKEVIQKQQTIKVRLPADEESPQQKELPAQEKSPVEKTKKDTYREPIE